MGFSSRFQLMLVAITEGSQSQVLINGSRGLPFPITQSVWQGCPLSPLLFNFAINALSYCIAAEQLAGQIQGLPVPSILLHYLQASYADDTHLVLDAEISNLLAAKTVLAKFANASGLAINWQKSEAR
jgi:hypothetical protein